MWRITGFIRDERDEHDVRKNIVHRWSKTICQIIVFKLIFEC